MINFIKDDKLSEVFFNKTNGVWNSPYEKLYDFNKKNFLLSMLGYIKDVKQKKGENNLTTIKPNKKISGLSEFNVSKSPRKETQLEKQMCIDKRNSEKNIAGTVDIPKDIFDNNNNEQRTSNKNLDFNSNKKKLYLEWENLAKFVKDDNSLSKDKENKFDSNKLSINEKSEKNKLEIVTRNRPISPTQTKSIQERLQEKEDYLNKKESDYIDDDIIIETKPINSHLKHKDNEENKIVSVLEEEESSKSFDDLEIINSDKSEEDDDEKLDHISKKIIHYNSFIKLKN